MSTRRGRLTRRVFVDLGLWMSAFGLLVGLVFPPVLVLMRMPSDVALRWPFQTLCVAAGLLVGGVNYLLARVVVGTRMRALARGMNLTGRHLAVATDTGVTGLGDLERWALPVDSEDELGTVAIAYNDLVAEVLRFQSVERAIASVSAAAVAAGRASAPERVAGAVLDALLEATAAGSGAVVREEASGLVVLSARDCDPQQLVAVGPGARRHRAAFTVGETPGMLVVETSQRDDDGLQRIVDLVADLLAMALYTADLQSDLRRQAGADELTGLSNRREGLDRLRQTLEQARATGTPTGVLMIDADHFKAVNDTYGHLVGDDGLRHLATTTCSALRPDDLLCRYGGEELLAVLPDADGPVVAAVAERVRSTVAASPWLLPGDGIPVLLTVSVGGAGAHGPVVDTVEVAQHQLLNRADAALYSAKRLGRDRVIMADPTGVP